MSKQLQDLTDRCLSEAAKIEERTARASTTEELRKKYCDRCMNQICGHAKRSALFSLWGQRMLTQEDRLLNNPNFADENDPRFDLIRRLNFQDMAHRAVQMEVADRRGDWQVPNIPKPQSLVLPGQGQIADLPPAPSLQTETVDEAVRALAAARGKAVDLPPPVRDADREIGTIGGDTLAMRGREAPQGFGFIEGKEPQQEDMPAAAQPEPKPKPQPRPRPKAPPPARKPGNTPMPAAGLMLGGHMAGADYLRDEGSQGGDDPWSVPPSHRGGAKKVDVGATIVLGGDDD